MCKQGDTKLLMIPDSAGSNRERDIDSCILSIVMALNAAGMRTIASCCGHGKQPGNIALADGRELIIAEDYEMARKIDKLFPPIN